MLCDDISELSLSTGANLRSQRYVDKPICTLSSFTECTVIDLIMQIFINACRMCHKFVQQNAGTAARKSADYPNECAENNSGSEQIGRNEK